MISEFKWDETWWNHVSARQRPCCPIPCLFESFTFERFFHWFTNVHKTGQAGVHPCRIPGTDLNTVDRSKLSTLIFSNFQIFSWQELWLTLATLALSSLKIRVACGFVPASNACGPGRRSNQSPQDPCEDKPLLLAPNHSAMIQQSFNVKVRVSSLSSISISSIVSFCSTNLGYHSNRCVAHRQLLPVPLGVWRHLPQTSLVLVWETVISSVDSHVFVSICRIWLRTGRGFARSTLELRGLVPVLDGAMVWASSPDFTSGIFPSCLGFEETKVLCLFIGFYLTLYVYRLPNPKMWIFASFCFYTPSSTRAFTPVFLLKRVWDSPRSSSLSAWTCQDTAMAKAMPATVTSASEAFDMRSSRPDRNAPWGVTWNLTAARSTFGGQNQAYRNGGNK